MPIAQQLIVTYSFGTQFHLTPLPLHQINIIRFVAYLASSGVAYSSIHTYHSGIRFLQLAQGLPDPCLASFPLLEYVLRGIHQLPMLNPCQLHLPFTPEILHLLFTSWLQASQVNHHNATMLWATCCTGFFVFMRSGEFTCPFCQTFRPSMFGPQDVTVDSHLNPRVVSICLGHSEADPFNNGVTIYLGRTDHVICPVTALLSYLALLGQELGPLFLFQGGATLAGHSFHIGAATTAARAGLEDSTIQTLGRWHSSAYLRYIHTPAQTLASTSSQLLQPIQRLTTDPQASIL